MDDLNSEQTLPPARVMRFDRMAELFQVMPELGQFMIGRPEADEGYRQFLDRLRLSETPEDAVVFAAFATQPRDAIAWGYDSVTALVQLSDADRVLAQAVADWLGAPDTDRRWRALQLAMFAPRRTAMVYLGLAVGWSGGPLAPNDLVSVPAWRAARAVSSGVLRAVGQGAQEDRAARLALALDRAAGLFRIN